MHWFVLAYHIKPQWNNLKFVMLQISHLQGETKGLVCVVAQFETLSRLTFCSDIQTY